jgi:hypothetical protein
VKRYSDLAGSEFEEDPEGKWVRYEDHEARVRELEAEVERLRESLQASRGSDPSRCPACYASPGHHYGWCKLATATALIERAKPFVGLANGVRERWRNDAEAFLAGQPAAPTCRTCKGAGKVIGDCGDSPNMWFDPCPDCQPAAPPYDPSFETCPCETAAEHQSGKCQPAAPTRTEAENLSAHDRIELECWRALFESPEANAARLTELARRGLKP